MKKQADLFASLEPEEKIQRMFAREVALILVAHVGRPMEPGEYSRVAEELAQRIAELARRRFVPEKVSG